MRRRRWRRSLRREEQMKPFAKVSALGMALGLAALSGCASESGSGSESGSESESARSHSPTPQRAGQPMDPAETLARAAAAQGASIVGDSDTAQRQIEAIADDMRRSMKLPDGARPIDPEAARSAARSVAGVRSVAWIDRSNLLVIVNSNEARSQATIDAICLALEPLGDTLGVVVNLQSGAARNGDELEIVSRDCQLEPGDRALLHVHRQVDVIPPEVRAQVQAQRGQAGTSAERRRQDEETRRILEANTPEM
jgi:hypothetical protein